MFYLLGGMVGVYFLYIIVALIFKHKVGLGFLIATGILMLIMSFFVDAVDILTAISCCCDAILIYFVKFFRVRDNSKNTEPAANAPEDQSTNSADTTENQKE